MKSHTLQHLLILYIAEIDHQRTPARVRKHNDNPSDFFFIRHSAIFPDEFKGVLPGNPIYTYDRQPLSQQQTNIKHMISITWKRDVLTNIVHFMVKKWNSLFHKLHVY